MTDTEIVYSSRVAEILDNDSDLVIDIIDATKSNEFNNNINSFINYSIKLGPLIVKRRYSEFENLRNCLIKLFPTVIIPPIPEKELIKSNLKNNLIIKSNSNNNNKLITYRKKFLKNFLNNCIKIELIKTNNFFLSFLDPELNFNDFLNLKDNLDLIKLSIFKLSPFDPLNSLKNQLYLTLPTPSLTSSVDLSSVNDLEFINFENKFQKYELILNNLLKINKKLIKNYNDLSVEMIDLGSNFNTLSILQDSNFIENMSKNFDKSLINLNYFKNLLELNFFDKLIELNLFLKIIKNLINYNKLKKIQLLTVERHLKQYSAAYSEYLKENPEDEELVLNESELQSALYVNANHSIYNKIPGLNKLNNYFKTPELSSNSNELFKIKLNILKCKKQSGFLKTENLQISNDIKNQLVEFNRLFKSELVELVKFFNNNFVEFNGLMNESWQEVVVGNE